MVYDFSKTTKCLYFHLSFQTQSICSSNTKKPHYSTQSSSVMRKCSRLVFVWKTSEHYDLRPFTESYFLKSKTWRKKKKKKAIFVWYLRNPFVIYQYVLLEWRLIKPLWWIQIFVPSLGVKRKLLYYYLTKFRGLTEVTFTTKWYLLLPNE